MPLVRKQFEELSPLGMTQISVAGFCLCTDVPLLHVGAQRSPLRSYVPEASTIA